MNTFDIYGFQLKIDEVRERLENSLSIEFIEHESEFFGEYYLAQLDDQETYKLYLNQIEGDFREEEHKDFFVLLNIDYSNDPDAFIEANRESMLGATPLYRRQIGVNVAKSYRFDGDDIVLIQEKVLN